MKAIRERIFTCFICLLVSISASSQCVISKNSQGSIITTCLTTGSGGTTVSQKVYLGSEFLGFPIWQSGTIDLDGRSNVQPCQIAFNVVKDEISYKLTADAEHSITGHPVAFSINGDKYTSQPYNVLGIKQRIYFLNLYAGKTRLLQHSKRKFIPKTADGNGYNTAKEDGYVGFYETTQEYFIQQEDNVIRPINLTQKSVLSAFNDKSDLLKAHTPKGRLTVDKVVELLTYYDSLPTQ